MYHDAQQTYLETEIATATPQRLRLMLIEGGLRFARQTAAHWGRCEFEAGWETLCRCRDVISELIGGVKTDGSELSRQVAAIYLYLHRTLTEAQAEQSPQKLGAVIRVLEEERQTWEEVCQVMPEAPEPPEPQAAGPAAAPSNRSPAEVALSDLSPGYGAFDLGGGSLNGGFTLEA